MCVCAQEESLLRGVKTRCISKTVPGNNIIATCEMYKRDKNEYNIEIVSNDTVTPYNKTTKQ